MTKQQKSVATDAWGIDNGYEDAMESWHDTPRKTRDAILKVMGAGPDEPHPPATDAVMVVTAGDIAEVAPGSTVVLEDGTEVPCQGQLPADLPLGYHQVRTGEGREQSLIVTPPKCVLPKQHIWGWAVQLYAARSRKSWGIGDLGDLRELGRWSADYGAGVLLVNPLNAAMPIVPQQSSPYYPSTRRYKNPLYIRVEDVPGASDSGVNLEQMSQLGRELNSQRQIDRDAIFRLKNEALGRIFQRFRGDAQFDIFRKEQGKSLVEYSTYCALAEEHGGDWRQWPAEMHRPSSAAVQKYAQEHASRVDYHAWLQWLLDRQLLAATRQTPIMQDLPIGVDRAGADAWAWHDVLAEGVSVGAPPDIYNANGQNWGLPPWIPHKLKAAAYRPFIETIRAALRHAGGLRIDHVMGLFRLYWIPEGFGAQEGTFVRYPVDDLLAIIALESQRAGAFVVGEDLGTVEPGMREALAERNILSYRVLWFEDDPPSTYPELALAAVSTHDLPTIAGVWTGSDLEAQRRIGMNPSDEAMQKMRTHLAQLSRVAEEATVDEVVQGAHRQLSEAPSLIITATLDDALAVEERPNMPGTTDQWPNWSIALPEPLEEIEQRPLPRQIAQMLSGRSNGQSKAKDTAKS